MEKVLLLAAIAIFATSCTEKRSGNVRQDSKEQAEGFYADNKEMIIYVIDNCEYIGGDNLWLNSAFLTHKGNCKFCIERNKSVTIK